MSGGTPIAELADLAREFRASEARGGIADVEWADWRRYAEIIEREIKANRASLSPERVVQSGSDASTPCTVVSMQLVGRPPRYAERDVPIEVAATVGGVLSLREERRRRGRSAYYTIVCLLPETGEVQIRETSHVLESAATETLPAAEVATWPFHVPESVAREMLRMPPYCDHGTGETDVKARHPATRQKVANPPVPGHWVYFYCDEHAPSDATDLPYAAALRAMLAPTGPATVRADEALPTEHREALKKLIIERTYEDGNYFDPSEATLDALLAFFSSPPVGTSPATVSPEAIPNRQIPPPIPPLAVGDRLRGRKDVTIPTVVANGDIVAQPADRGYTLRIDEITATDVCWRAVERSDALGSWVLAWDWTREFEKIESVLAIELRFTVGPWFETEKDEYDRTIEAPARVENASCVGVENDTARAWDWGKTTDLDGNTPKFNWAASTGKWPASVSPAQYNWAIYTPNGTDFEPGFVHYGNCPTLGEAQMAANAALAEYCANGRRSAGGTHV